MSRLNSLFSIQERFHLSNSREDYVRKARAANCETGMRFAERRVYPAFLAENGQTAVSSARPD
jgi:hypothetical protein